MLQSYHNLSVANGCIIILLFTMKIVPTNAIEIINTAMNMILDAKMVDDNEQRQ